MAIPIPTLQETIVKIKNKILDRNKEMGTVDQPGNAIGDIFVIPLANEIDKQRIINSFISRLQSLNEILLMLSDTDYLTNVANAYGILIADVETIIKEVIDEYALNVGTSREQPIYATGVVQYGRKTVLTPAEGDFIVYPGSIVETAAGIRYITTVQTTMYVDNASSYWNADLMLYVIDVPVIAEGVGSTGNTEAFGVINMSTAVAGFDTVTNKDAITGGYDEETNENLINRVKLSYLGNNRGSRYGIEKLIYDNTDITDLYVVMPGNAYSIRDEGTGGSIDVYIIDEKLESILETFNPPIPGDPYQILTKRPVSSVNSVSEGTWAFEKDTLTINRGSIKSNDRIAFTVLPINPYTVSYLYNTNIELVQNLINKDENKVLGADILIKEATRIYIDISFVLNVLPGYSKAVVIANITQILNSNIQTLSLNTPLQQSDIVEWVYGVSGVDQIILPFTKFNRTSESTVVNTITVAPYEYIRLLNLNIL